MDNATQTTATKSVIEIVFQITCNQETGDFWATQYRGKDVKPGKEKLTPKMVMDFLSGTGSPIFVRDGGWNVKHRWLRYGEVRLTWVITDEVIGWWHEQIALQQQHAKQQRIAEQTNPIPAITPERQGYHQNKAGRWVDSRGRFVKVA